MKIKLIRLCCFSALLLGLPAVGQVESMLNSGFEAGNFANWVLAGDYGNTFVYGGSGFVPHSGSYEALLGNDTASGTLSQTVATTPGTTYVLSCWFNNSFGDPGQFSVAWGGSMLLNETNPAANGWTNYQFTVTATQASTVVQFGFFDNAANNFALDDVSLQTQTNIAPTITIQPTNVTVNAGQGVTFSVAATGSTPINYQWQFGEMAIAGANSSSYTIGSMVPTNAGNYSCAVGNSAGTTNSVMATLTVITNPVITLQPTDVTVYAGQPATFSVTAVGPEPLYYQWRFGVNGTNIIGATNATLVLTNVQVNQSGNYSALVSNFYGSTNSVAAVLTVITPLPSSAELLPFPLSANQRGTVICLENRSYTYDIYLPPNYSPYRNPLPIFYTMNSGGGGMVSTFQSTCANLGIICVGITGSANGVPWTKELREMYAVTLDIRQRVLFDPTAEFAGGASGGGVCSYMFSRLRAQHVAGVFEMAGWLARGNSWATVQYYGIDRVQTNLLVARTTGTSDTAALFYNPYDSNFLATCGAVIKDWSFNGGHGTAPSSLFSPILTWLLSQRIPAGPSDYTNAFMLYTNWQDRIAAGQQETVLRECVSNLMNFPRSWYAYQAQMTLDHLLTNYTVFRSLNVSNLAQGDFASDLFFYYAYGAATNRDWSRYNSCMKALTGITVTNDFDGTTIITDFPAPPPFTGDIGIVYITSSNGDRAGDIYNLLTNYNHYPSPQLQCASSPSSDQLNLWLNKDTPGLAYTLQSSPSLSGAFWQTVPAIAVDINTLWSATDGPISTMGSGFYRILAAPSPATSPPWTAQ